MTISSYQVCILLGSNIQPEVHIPQAIALIAQHISVSRISSVWETEAVGSNGPNFLNAAVLGYSHLDPAQLKEKVLRPLEAEMGRVRTQDKNAARTIDLDIVVFNGRPIDRDLWRYAHVAVPVAELLPVITHPVSGLSLQEKASQLALTTIIKRRTDLNLLVAMIQKPAGTASRIAPASSNTFRLPGSR